MIGRDEFFRRPVRLSCSSRCKPLPRGNVVHDALTGWIARHGPQLRRRQAAATPGSSGRSRCSRRRSPAGAVFVLLRGSTALLGLAFDVARCSTSRSAFASSATTSPTSAPRSSAATSRGAAAARRVAPSRRERSAGTEFLRHVIEHSLLAAHRHVFGVFFWFVLLSTVRPRAGRRGAVPPRRIRRAATGRTAAAAPGSPSTSG